MSVILVSLHCTVGIAMAGIYHLLCVIHVGCTIRVLLYCTVGIAMTGMYYSLYVFSSRVPVKLTGGATIGVNDTTSVCLLFW